MYNNLDQLNNHLAHINLSPPNIIDDFSKELISSIKEINSSFFYSNIKQQKITLTLPIITTSSSIKDISIFLKKNILSLFEELELIILSKEILKRPHQFASSIETKPYHNCYIFIDLDILNQDAFYPWKTINSKMPLPYEFIETLQIISKVKKINGIHINGLRLPIDINLSNNASLNSRRTIIKTLLETTCEMLKNWNCKVITKCQ